MKGEIIKNIRLEKGYTLADLAARIGYTASYLSQLERNLKQPSLEALRKIADGLNTPIITFLMDGNEKYIPSEPCESDTFERYALIKGTSRRRMVVPEIGTVYQFITPVCSQTPNKPRMLGFYNELKPKAWVSEKLVIHEPEESIIVIEGQVDIYVDDKVFTLARGDSFYIAPGVPHNIKNPADTNAVIVAYQFPAMY